ncbi:centrosomal protein of 72 kDa isoform X2 [Talpa occidentalis]|uniref:centrosomal protein of 72 kDa isoform X2 n=1 Tax=Talpa occidentalis TaxID=50954 RepID=UPI00188EF306|nr:centrosomal protein of 72 kDa isoform X2 [Talpa occidentalis]
MAPAGPRLVLCEERIREKSGLPPHRDLAELRTLSVPGTYQEKITHLGNALMHLTGLTSLDLSRNALVSLEGIQYLAALQSLNLYYNCISSLAEVLRLRALARLSDLDLRLNPVVQCEPDSRLLVLHVLPQLRRLDDRPVRESERTASRLHFASEDSLDSPQSSPAFLRVSRPRLCRARRKDPAAKKGLALDADDEAVLNLIAECEWGLSTPPGSASSGQKEREVDLRGPQGPTDSGDSGASSQRPSLSAQTLLEPPPVPGKCRKRRVLGGRAQAPVEQECLTCLELPEGPASPASPASPGEGLSSSEGQHEQTFPPKEVSEPGEPRTPSWGSARQASPRLPVAPAPKRKAALELARLEALLDLVDRHWSGRRSLHSHEAFLAQARRVLSSTEELTSPDSSAVEREEMSCLALENRALRSQLAQQQQQHSAKMREVVSALGSARQEMENSSLKLLLSTMKQEVRDADASAALGVQVSGLQTSVKRLSAEIVELKELLEHGGMARELTHMLQESHSSLVSTNERLLQELSKLQAQHQAEVEQLHWSYRQLKKTLALAPHGPPASGASLGGRS